MLVDCSGCVGGGLRRLFVLCWRGPDGALTLSPNNSQCLSPNTHLATHKTHTSPSQVHTQLSRQCLQLAVSAGKQGDWATTLGAVRVGRLLGATADSLTAMSTAAGASNGAGGQQQQQQGGGLVEQLRELRERAMADNGTAAHLFCEALGRLLPQVVSS